MLITNRHMIDWKNQFYMSKQKLKFSFKNILSAVYI